MANTVLTEMKARGIAAALRAGAGDPDRLLELLERESARLERLVGADGYQLLGVLFFAGLGFLLYRAGRKPPPAV